MEKSAAKVVFVCQECGKESLKWLGRCPECQQWNSFAEMVVKTSTVTSRPLSPLSAPLELSGVEIEKTPRTPLPLAEFNRVLGGGLVAGSMVLVSGDPGIGKSTLLLQAAIYGKTAVYEWKYGFLYGRLAVVGPTRSERSNSPSAWLRLTRSESTCSLRKGPTWSRWSSSPG